MADAITVRSRGQETYRIVFHTDFSGLASALLEDGLLTDRICVVCDSNTGPLYLDAVRDALSKLEIPVFSHCWAAGEEHKTAESVFGLYDTLLENGFSRKSLLVSLGGGVTGDMTGFAAATYMRGIRFVQIPTTLLSQVDASIGGKTGYDYHGYKNMIGAFHMPSLVYLNLRTLDTLSDREYRSGLAEVVKTAVLGDRELYDVLAGSRDRVVRRDESILLPMVKQSCLIKQKIVEEDPLERGRRMLLNLGHTIGHAVEKALDFSMAHGECVALGMLAASYISAGRGLMTKEELLSLKEFLSDLQIPVSADLPPAEELLRFMKSDKKAESGRLKFVLPVSIGDAVVTDDVTAEEIIPAIAFVRN